MVKMKMLVPQKTAEWAADEFINYFSNFQDIEDYLRFVKKEVLTSRTSLVSLSDEFFNEDMHPEDMEFNIVRLVKVDSIKNIILIYSQQFLLITMSRIFLVEN